MSENYQNTTRTPVAAISPEERQRREMQSIADRAYERAKQESKKEISNLTQKHKQETEKLNAEYHASLSKLNLLTEMQKVNEGYIYSVRKILNDSKQTHQLRVLQ